MARSYSVVEINKFIAGLNTDSSPLTTPENTSLDEVNMVLNTDGSRNRRFGMDYEAGFSNISTTVPNGGTTSLMSSTYRWDNAGGIPDKSILVVQIGNQLKFYHLATDPVSTQLITTHTITTASPQQLFSFSVVDGILIIVSGISDVRIAQFTAPSTITFTGRRLYVRDFWGVEDVMGSTDLLSGNDIQYRPVTNTNNHLYNLRNQSWGISRIQGNNETLIDPITYFEDVASQYPSNSDTVNEALYPDAQDTDNRTIERFFAFDLFRNAVGSSRAPNGHYIIDVVERGASRYNNVLASESRYPELVTGGQTIAPLPLDITPGGATCVTEFAGRAWYGGFSSLVTSGDRQSPKLTSYILFSKIVENSEDIYKCYQVNDPTSKDSNEILDTDGGFIRLNEAYNIKKMINVGSSLIVIAANGVWRVFGGDNGFTATSYIVEKITDKGCTSPNSIVQADTSILFWTDDGIYNITTDQFGAWVSNNVSINKIQKFYESISITARRLAIGSYDSYDKKVRWLFNNQTNSTLETGELVLDTQLAAYYVNEINKFGELNYPKAIGYYEGNLYNDENGSQREISYVILTGVSPNASYTFGKYRNSQFRDWFSVDSIGVDADAYMITNYISGGDFMRRKGVTYIVTHFRRTETGYDVDMNPLNASSCLMQARWDWADSDASGKWGREFQAYRYRKLYLPLDDSDDYDNGFLTIASRNKLRGDGKVLSIRFRTEPYKNLHMYGWSMMFSVSENV